MKEVRGFKMNYTQSSSNKHSNFSNTGNNQRSGSAGEDNAFG